MITHSIRIRSLSAAFTLLFVGFITTGDVMPDESLVDPSALLISASEGDLPGVKQDINNGSDLNARDELGRTPLIMAAAYGHDEIVRLLILNGAEINAKNNCGQTALMFASQNGHPNVVKVLIDAGTDLNAHADDGTTALIFASVFHHPDIAEILLNHGADPAAINNHSQTALIAAASVGNHELAELLVARGANVNFPDLAGLPALRYALSQGHFTIADLLLEAGSDIERQDNSGITALMDAAIADNETAVRFLLDKGADIDARQQDDVSALLFAAALGNLPTVELLTESGAEIDAKARDGQTPLIAAAGEGHLAVVQVLLEAGADATLQTIFGFTALTSAFVNEHQELSDFLRERQAGPGRGSMESTYLPFPVNTKSVDRILNLFSAPDLPATTYTLVLDEEPVIPEKVTYISITATDNKQAAGSFLEKCENGIAGQIEMQGDLMIIGPHLTTLLNRSAVLSELDYSTVIIHLQSGMPGILIGSGIREDSIPSVFRLIRNLLFSGGPVTVRKLSGRELDWYWASISWDIEEPIYVFENTRHKVLIDFGEDESMFYVDLFDNLQWVPTFSKQ